MPLIQPTTQLAYTASTDPDPLTVHTQGAHPATLSIIVTPQTSVEIEKITLTLPIGDGAHDLTPSPEAIRPRLPEGWTVKDRGYQQDRTKYDIALGPELDDPVTVDHQTVFTLDTITVARKTGTCTLLVAEKTPQDSAPGEAEIPLQKFGRDFRINSFGPEASVIGYDGKANLTWDVTGASEYDVTWYESGKRHHQPLPASTHRWTSPPLKSTTPIALTAYAKSDSGGQLVYTMSTVVMVRHSDTETGSLTVHGSVDIVRPDPIICRPDRRQILLDGKNSTSMSCTFTSETDGLLYIQPVHPDKTAGPLLELRIPQNTNHLQDEARFHLPLHVLAAIPLRKNTRLIAQRWGKVQEVAFEYSWFPLGEGKKLDITR